MGMTKKYYDVNMIWNNEDDKLNNLNKQITKLSLGWEFLKTQSTKFETN